MNRAQGFLLFVAIALTAIFSVYKASPPDVVPASAPDTVFSAARAFPYLKQVARAPHSMGTVEHMRVRSFIVNHCSALGLETTVQEAVATGSFRGRPMVFAGKVYNIIARLKGSGTGKAVAVMAHYDSHPNTIGAGDDGAAVAAMLETARILKNGRPLQNDVLFVFTDGEESGLIGAKAFIESGLANDIGIVLNFEARGSGGISNMFEVNNENGWVMQHFAKAAAHPFANSLSFEVYKLLPNDTDFTLFKKAGITGLNHAFIEHLEDYHSMTDTPENLDKRSLQHHGANMLSLTRHFANTSLEQTKGPDQTYFNMLGSWLVMYPDWLNLLFVMIVFLLALYYIFQLFRNKRTSPAALAHAIFIFLFSLILMGMLTWAIQQFIAYAYPYNSRFYENNAYNSKWYFLAVSAAGLGVFALCYQWAVRKKEQQALIAGIIVVQTILMVAMKVMMPTATYLFCFPLMLLLVAQILLMRTAGKDASGNWIHFAFSIPAVLLFAPTIYAVFIAFGLGPLMPGAVVVTGLLLGFLLPLLLPLLQQQKYFLRTVAAIIFLAAMLIADRKAKFSESQPLQSNIWYLEDADKHEAFWISDHVRTDPYSGQFLQNAVVETADNRQGFRMVSKAPVAGKPHPLAKADSAKDDSSTRIHCSSPRNALSMSVAISIVQPLTNLQVDGREVEKKYAIQEGKYVYTLQYYAVPEEGFYVTVHTGGKIPFTLTLTDRSLGLPGIETPRFPRNMIPGEGRTSYTTQVRKRFDF